MRLVTIVVAGAALALAASPARPAPDEVVVTREPLVALPIGCRPSDVASLLARFFDAVNTGRSEAIRDLFFADDPPGMALEPADLVFRWYSMTEVAWRHTVLYDREDLPPYFRDRHAHGERMRLLALAVGPLNRDRRSVGVTVAFRREADDLPDGLGGRQRIAFGKAGIVCAERQIYLWSTGMQMARGRELPTGFAWPCPRPAGWTVSGPTVACSKGANARATQPNFHASGRARVPAPCSGQGAERYVRSALVGFNLGWSSRFARRFSSTAVFRPYRTQLRGRWQIARFVRLRYEAGDGWTARSLTLHRAPRQARTVAYRLRLRVTHQTAVVGDRVVQLVLACRSGLVVRWSGPRVDAPS